MNVKSFIGAYLCMTVIIGLASFVINSLLCELLIQLSDIFIASAMLWFYRIQPQEQIAVNIQADGRLSFPANNLANLNMLNQQTEPSIEMV